MPKLPALPAAWRREKMRRAVAANSLAIAHILLPMHQLADRCTYRPPLRGREAQ